ncbi:TPA: 23S rRNA methyltransferase attenuation leader peptide [Enterococcus faecium]|nr:23S rRNA methyltransferase attenuation leader peptide [Enterococcus faecalis]HBL8428884.1 23S rRNA methyltransferase attenuation leader peptide [Enterococcus faecium]HDJ7429036.1 23S rRNA methyltransferase attenuation leader peptide [Staphylococcus aureus]HEL1173807.1 23S rRNA methyltransferase attenuation leader peptide [Streptococcus equi subsp. zooepidemicus]HEL2003620.1 23S rRNA methyltransferase attenuation leader peptide [Streptococcus suis]HET0511165.1 23S rRNA methyltransferase atte
MLVFQMRNVDKTSTV